MEEAPAKPFMHLNINTLLSKNLPMVAINMQLYKPIVNIIPIDSIINIPIDSPKLDALIIKAEVKTPPVPAKPCSIPTQKERVNGFTFWFTSLV